MMKHLVIIGNGITGITLANRYRERSQDKITVVSSETKHFYSRPALMYIFMGHMKFEQTKPYEDWHWDKQNIHLLEAKVESVHFAEKTLQLEGGASLSYDTLVLATGSKSNLFNWPGQDLKGVQGLYGYPDLLSMEKNTQGVSHAVVVGGGLIGVEMVEMLLSRKIKVSFLVREKKFWGSVLPLEEANLVERHIREHSVDLRMGSELKEIFGDRDGKVERILTVNGDSLPCGFVGITVGVSPNIGFLKGTTLEMDRGILIDDHFRTNIPDVYSAGDCAQFRQPQMGRKPVEQVWYTGKMQAEFLAGILLGETTSYRPGIWFNSAKFFDIEYQIYGNVPAGEVAGESSFYWEHKDGRKSFRIQYRTSDFVVLGFNFMGIRGRHRVCESWIAEGRTLEYVLTHLGALNFDPEFQSGFESKVIEKFNSENPEKKVILKTRKGLFSRLAVSIEKSTRKRSTVQNEK